MNEKLSPDEVGCYNCIKWRTGLGNCNNCRRFSKFKNIEFLNRLLKEKELDYLCVSSIEQLRKNINNKSDWRKFMVYNVKITLKPKKTDFGRGIRTFNKIIEDATSEEQALRFAKEMLEGFLADGIQIETEIAHDENGTHLGKFIL